MCFRCYENDPAPSPEMRAHYAAVDAALPADATGADIVDAVATRSRTERGDDYLVRVLIRSAKRSGVGINSPKTPAEKARPVLRAVAAGRAAVAP